MPREDVILLAFRCVFLVSNERPVQCMEVWKNESGVDQPEELSSGEAVVLLGPGQLGTAAGRGGRVGGGDEDQAGEERENGQDEPDDVHDWNVLRTLDEGGTDPLTQHHSNGHRERKNPSGHQPLRLWEPVLTDHGGNTDCQTVAHTHQALAQHIQAKLSVLQATYQNGALWDWSGG